MIQRLILLKYILTVLMLSSCNSDVSEHRNEFIGGYVVNMEKCVEKYPAFNTARYSGMYINIMPDNTYEVLKPFGRITSKNGTWYLERVDMGVFCNFVSENGVEMQFSKDLEDNLMIFIDAIEIGDSKEYPVSEHIYLYLKRINYS